MCLFKRKRSALDKQAELLVLLTHSLEKEVDIVRISRDTFKDYDKELGIIQDQLNCCAQSLRKLLFGPKANQL